MKNRILVIDGMYLVFSSFYSHANMRTIHGDPTGALYGFITRLEFLRKELEPDHIVTAFDSRAKTFRHELFPEYKAKRDAPPEDLIRQLPDIKEYIDLSGMQRIENPGFEADDIIAGICRDYSDYEKIIFTADKDLFQLVDDNVRVFHPKHKVLLDFKGIKETYGVAPDRIVDFLSLMGDSSDNIPGVPGVGEKTALKILDKYNSVDNIINNIDDIEDKFKKKIKPNLDKLILSRKLVDLKLETYPDIPELLPAVKADNFRLAEFYRKFSFTSLVKKLGQDVSTDSDIRLENYEYVTVRKRDELESLKSEIIKNSYFAFDVETTGLNFYDSEIAGISVAFENRGYYIPFLYPQQAEGQEVEFAFKDFSELFADVFKNSNIKKTGHNLKFDVLHLRDKSLEINGVYDDSMIASYLLYPNRRTHALKELSAEFLNYSQKTYAGLCGTGKSAVSIDKVDLDKVAPYCIDDSAVSLKLVKILREKLKEEGLLDLYTDVELPLSCILTDMEYYGVLLDTEYLKTTEKDVVAKIMALEEEIYSSAGVRFNINSSQQLGEILFEKLNLPVQKKTRKTGKYSTDINVLNELRSYPFVEKIIGFRALNKILSTYVKGLLKDVDSEQRVHTTYNQAVTATGRLSSSNPNLQNIPVDSSTGIDVRKAFVPSKNTLFMAADYSQIELRVMAHCSEDKELIHAFSNDIDIHSHTASQVFGKNLFMSEHEMRKRAKIINFSILYGASPFTLSKELGVSYADAKNYIETYFEKYSGVSGFIDDVHKKVVEDQTVETLLNRKRKIPEVMSSNKNVRENGFRMAVNTIIQGSAADIIKLAMLNISEKLTGSSVRMIIQVHDELIFEYRPEDEEFLYNCVKNEMESAFKLSVPLKVSIKKGFTWGEMTPFNL